MLITYCIPCQHGQHQDHHQLIEAVPEGMMGGAECHCTGECKGFKQDTQVIIESDEEAHQREQVVRDLERISTYGLGGGQCPYSEMEWYCILPEGHQGPHQSQRIS